MSFDALEKSTSGGALYELYLFSMTGRRYALTSSSQAIVYEGVTYSPAAIYREETEQSKELTSTQLKVHLPKGHDLAQLFIPYLPNSPVDLTIYAGHWDDAEVEPIFVGFVMSINVPMQGDDDSAVLLCGTDQERINRQLPRLCYQALCAHVLGDDYCGVDLTKYTWQATVTSVSSDGATVGVASAETIPAAILSGGYLKFGYESRFIVTHAGATLTLMNGLSDLAVGDAIQVTAGCPHTYAGCQNYFANVDHHLGFDLIPTQNPFDGSIV